MRRILENSIKRRNIPSELGGFRRNLGVQRLAPRIVTFLPSTSVIMPRSASPSPGPSGRKKTTAGKAKAKAKARAAVLKKERTSIVLMYSWHY